MITQKPDITVLMAIYNCSSTLEEALDSLMVQTYQNFKVVLCDDASTDNTYEVAKRYSHKYPNKFILIKNDINLKLPATLNRCLEVADTEFVARMDGDDISKPTRFEKEIVFLRNHPDYAFVSTPMEYFDENGTFMTGNVEADPNKYSFLKGSPFSHAGVMMRTEALKNIGGYTVERWTRRGQDFHLWGKFYGAGYKGHNLTEALYMMRDDKNAYNRRTFKERIYAIRRTYEVHKLVGLPVIYRYKCLSPLLRAFAPRFVYNYFHKKILTTANS